MAKGKQFNQLTNDSYFSDNSYETLREGSMNAAKSVLQEGKKAMTSMLTEIWNAGEEIEIFNFKGDLQANEELDLKQVEKKKKENSFHIQPGLNYQQEILHFNENISRQETQELRKHVDIILMELQKLSVATSYVEQKVEEAKGNAIVKPGKYHVNFFEWLLLVVKEARLKIQDSGAWLSVMGSKKSQKRYWAMAKKFGNNFTQSAERNLSNALG